MAQGVNKLLDVGSLFRRLLHFASVQTLELGKFLSCALGGTRADERLSEPVVDGRGVTVFPMPSTLTHYFPYVTYIMLRLVSAWTQHVRLKRASANLDLSGSLTSQIGPVKWSS